MNYKFIIRKKGSTVEIHETKFNCFISFKAREKLQRYTHETYVNQRLLDVGDFETINKIANALVECAAKFYPYEFRALYL